MDGWMWKAFLKEKRHWLGAGQKESDGSVKRRAASSWVCENTGGIEENKGFGIQRLPQSSLYSLSDTYWANLLMSISPSLDIYECGITISAHTIEEVNAECSKNTFLERKNPCLWII